MKYWIIPANPTIYNLEDALKELPNIDWRQHNNFEIGDVVYIYCSKPISKILYKMEVIEVDITREYIIEDKRYWSQPSEYENSIKNNRFIRLKFIAENKTDKLTLSDLYNNGLKGAPRGALMVREPLLGYILDVM